MKNYEGIKTKRATFLKVDNKIFKTSNSRENEGRKFEEVKTMNSPYEFENLGEFENINDALYHFIGIQIEERKLQKEINLKYKIEEENKLSELLKMDVIPSTIENIAIILKKFNKSNFGTFKLPKMSIGYQMLQYDCEGVIISTIQLDKPINGIKKYKIGSKRGHLLRYTQLG